MQIFAKEQLKNIPEVQRKARQSCLWYAQGLVRRQTLMNPRAEICGTTPLAPWQWVMAQHLTLGNHSTQESEGLA